MKRHFALLVLLFACLSGSALALDQYLINSADWRDVYVGMQYGHFLDGKARFVDSPPMATFVTRYYGQGGSLVLIQSEDLSYYPSYKSYLESQGLVVTENLVSKNPLEFQFELAKRLKINKFIVVSDDYGYNAMSVGPYAFFDKSVVLFANRGNVESLKSFFGQVPPKTLLVYGHVDNEVKDALERYNPEYIDTGSRFDDNLEIVKKFRQRKQTEQILFSNGEFIEAELVTGGMGAQPVLFIGKNYVPPQTMSYIINDPTITIAILVGNELYSSAQKVREASNKRIHVFVKFAQGVSTGESMKKVSALDMFYLPRYKLSLEVRSVKYNLADDSVILTIENKAAYPTYVINALTFSQDDALIGSTGDKNAVFIDRNQTKSIRYVKTGLQKFSSKPIAVEVYSTYGPAPRDMEEELRYNGVLETVRFEDESEIEVLSLGYSKSVQHFILRVKNVGEKKVFLQANLWSVVINGEKRDLASQVASLDPGEEREISFAARMDEADLFENQKSGVDLTIYYGASKDLLIKELSRHYDFTLISEFEWWWLVAIILLLVLLYFAYRWLKEKGGIRIGGGRERRRSSSDGLSELSFEPVSRQRRR